MALGKLSLSELGRPRASGAGRWLTASISAPSSAAMPTGAQRPDLWSVPRGLRKAQCAGNRCLIALHAHRRWRSGRRQRPRGRKGLPASQRPGATCSDCAGGADRRRSGPWLTRPAAGARLMDALRSAMGGEVLAAFAKMPRRLGSDRRLTGGAALPGASLQRAMPEAAAERKRNSASVSRGFGISAQPSAAQRSRSSVERSAETIRVGRAP